jgi:hypothetical protein
MPNLIDAMAGAECAGLAVYVRAFLARLASNDPRIVALVISVSFAAPGVSTIEWEAHTDDDMAVAGGSL